MKLCCDNSFGVLDIARHESRRDRLTLPSVMKLSLCLKQQKQKIRYSSTCRNGLFCRMWNPHLRVCVIKVSSVLLNNSKGNSGYFLRNTLLVFHSGKIFWKIKIFRKRILSSATHVSKTCRNANQQRLWQFELLLFDWKG